MNELRQAIAVGPYPAPCFDDTWDSKEHQHRRFLRRLAEQGKIRMVDSAGTPLKVKAVVTGGIHFDLWHVDAHDAQVILEQIEVETVRREEERQKAAEAARKAAEEREAEKKRRDEEQKARRDLLKVAGQWSHPLYETLKAARADGWHERRVEEIGGEEITMKGHTLVRNATRAQSTKQKRFVYKTTLSKVYGLTPTMIDELGDPDEYCDNPHWKSGPPASLYSIERVETWIEENKERVEKARQSRVVRSAASKRVHDKKRAERYESAKAWVTGLAITVNQPFTDTLLADAQACFSFHGHQDCLMEKGLHAYVRHRLANYESLLQELYDQEFSRELYPLLRQRIDAEVRTALADWKNSQASSEASSCKHQPAFSSAWA